MPDSTENPIFVRNNADAGQWTASFDGLPQVAFGGMTAIGAVRRLLEGAEAGHGTYTLKCDPDSAPAGEISESVVWAPPELLVPCHVCKGRGEYVGLLVVEKCGTCGGRLVVPG